MSSSTAATIVERWNVGENRASLLAIAVRTVCGARLDVDVDVDDYFVTDNAMLVRLGGVTKDDRLDTVHLNANGRASLVHCNPHAVDVELFSHPDESAN